MLPVTKHPDSERIVIADFAAILPPGVTLMSVLDAPTVIERDPPTAAEMGVGQGAINEDEVAVANGERPVAAYQGVQFTVSGGDDQAIYWVRTRALTSEGAKEAVDLPVRVDRRNRP